MSSVDNTILNNGLIGTATLTRQIRSVDVDHTFDATIDGNAHLTINSTLSSVSGFQPTAEVVIVEDGGELQRHSVSVGNPTNVSFIVASGSRYVITITTSTRGNSAVVSYRATLTEHVEGDLYAPVAQLADVRAGRAVSALNSQITADNLALQGRIDSNESSIEGNADAIAELRDEAQEQIPADKIDQTNDKQFVSAAQKAQIGERELTDNQKRLLASLTNNASFAMEDTNNVPLLQLEWVSNADVPTDSASADVSQKALTDNQAQGFENGQGELTEVHNFSGNTPYNYASLSEIDYAGNDRVVVAFQAAFYDNHANNGVLLRIENTQDANKPFILRYGTYAEGSLQNVQYYSGGPSFNTASGHLNGTTKQVLLVFRPNSPTDNKLVYDLVVDGVGTTGTIGNAVSNDIHLGSAPPNYDDMEFDSMRFGWDGGNITRILPLAELENVPQNVSTRIPEPVTTRERQVTFTIDRTNFVAEHATGGTPVFGFRYNSLHNDRELFPQHSLWNSSLEFKPFI